MIDSFPNEIDEQLWDEACRRADMIRDFLKHRTSRSTVDNVAGLAAQLELSQATTYRLINLFNAGGNVMSLVDRKPGRPEGHRALDEEREEIIRATIASFYLKRNRPSISRLVREVQMNCILAGRKPPHRRTIEARLEDIDLQKRAKRRGEKKIVKATTATPGASSASCLRFRVKATPDLGSRSLCGRRRGDSRTRCRRDFGRRQHQFGLGGFVRPVGRSGSGSGAGLGSVEGLDLRLVVDRQHHGMSRRIDIQANDGRQLLGEGRVVGELEVPPAMRAETVGLPDTLHRRR